MAPRKECKICKSKLVDFPAKAPQFMIDYFEFCPECKTVFYVGEDI